MRLFLAGKIIPKNEGVSTGAKGTLVASFWLITTLHYFWSWSTFYQWDRVISRRVAVASDKSYMIRSDKHGLVSCGKAHHSGGVTKACFCFFLGCHWPFYWPLRKLCADWVELEICADNPRSLNRRCYQPKNKMWRKNETMGQTWRIIDG